MQRRSTLHHAAAPAGLSEAPSHSAAGASSPLGACKRQVITQDGVRLHYTDWGRGDPILFVASANVPSAMWGAQIAALSPRYRCIAYDRRGHGQSDIPGEGYDYDTLADDLASVIETLDLTGVTLVGHSMGCGEVVRYLSRHGSARVRRAVLIGAVTPLLIKTADNPDGIDPQAIEMVRDSWRYDLPQWVADNVDAFFHQPASPAMKQWLGAMLLTTPLPVVMRLNEGMAGADFRAELAGVTTPTLLIHGAHDVSAPLALTAERTVALMPDARLKLYPDAAHGVFLTHLDAVNADITGFMQD